MWRVAGWQRSTRRPSRPQDNGRDNIDKHSDDVDNKGDNHGVVRMNARESDGADENRDSPIFAVEAICQFNANVIACHLTTGDRRWYIVRCYLSPFDNTKIWYVEAAMVDCRRGAELIFAGDLNVDLERISGQGPDEEITVAVETVGLEDISTHFLLRGRVWN